MWHFILADAWSLLPWQAHISFCNDRHIVQFVFWDTWSFLLWQTNGPFYLTDTWSPLPWQTHGTFYSETLGDFYPDRHVVSFTRTNITPLSWQAHDPFYPDRHIVYITLIDIWSFSLWQTHGPFYPDRHIVPDRYVVPLTRTDITPLFWQIHGLCYFDRHMVPFTLTNTALSSSTHHLCFPDRHMVPFTLKCGPFYPAIYVFHLSLTILADVSACSSLTYIISAFFHTCK